MRFELQIGNFREDDYVFGGNFRSQLKEFCKSKRSAIFVDIQFTAPVIRTLLYTIVFGHGGMASQRNDYRILLLVQLLLF